MIFSKHKRRGFSLVELMIVVAIIGILIAVLLPELGDMATRSRISTAQQSMNAMRNAIIRYQANEGRKLKRLEWLVPRYMQEIKRDPWGNPYTVIPDNGIIVSAGPDGALEIEDSKNAINRDNIIVSYLPPLCISDAKLTVDANDNSLIDNGDIITIYFSIPPYYPKNGANKDGDDFTFEDRYDYPGSNEIPHGDENADDNSNLGKLATTIPDGNCPDDPSHRGIFHYENGTYKKSYNFVNLRVIRKGDQNSCFTANLFVRFNEQAILAPVSEHPSSYADNRGSVAINHNNYNTRVKKPGEL